MTNEDKELLDWELSLDSCDIRAHAWYHGSLSRQKAEALLVCNGDFLVRDCSSSGRPGDYVLSCRWDDTNLHFLIQKDVLQKETIYESLRYRFESEGFDTIPDLITYHVGSEIPISAGSGALISIPVNRTTPLLKGYGRVLVSDSVRGDYVSIMSSSYNSLPRHLNKDSQKVSTLERVKQKALLLDSIPGLLEELNQIPERYNTRKQDVTYDINRGFKQENDSTKGSNFDLINFQSILLPADTDITPKNAAIFKEVTSRLLESSERIIALTITDVDWRFLHQVTVPSSVSPVKTPENLYLKTFAQEPQENIVKNSSIYPPVFQDSQHRWNLIERSLTFSHFVVITVLMADNPEEVMHKWIGVASELKSSTGNFYSFSSIMRGLLMPQLTRCDGKVDWMKLRQQYTESAFTFETSLRRAYQGLVRGTESYPPNTAIPELFSVALILEDVLEMLPLCCVSAEDDRLEFYFTQLEQFRSLTSWSDVQNRNFQRTSSENNRTDREEEMLLLNDIFRAEFQLLLLWAHGYPEKSLSRRCAEINF